jgi:hypothetical protein
MVLKRPFVFTRDVMSALELASQSSRSYAVACGCQGPLAKMATLAARSRAQEEPYLTSPHAGSDSAVRR